MTLNKLIKIEVGDRFGKYNEGYIDLTKIVAILEEVDSNILWIILLDGASRGIIVYEKEAMRIKMLHDEYIDSMMQELRDEGFIK